METKELKTIAKSNIAYALQQAQLKYMARLLRRRASMFREHTEVIGRINKKINAVQDIICIRDIPREPTDGEIDPIMMD